MTEDELRQSVVHISELLDRNRFAQAQRLVSDALPHFPDDQDLLFFAGYLALKDDNLDEAERHTSHLLGIHPESYGGRNLMADIHEERGQFAQSEEIMLSVLADYPEDTNTIAHYAMLMLRTMHIEKAGKLAEEALRRDPDHVTAIQVATLASIVQGNRDERDARLSEMIRKHPEMQATAATLTQVLHGEGRYSEALQVSQEMLRAQPDNQDIVDLVISQRQLSHWSMIPMRPFIRYGWTASIGLWFVAVIGFRLLPETPVTTALLTLLLVFVVYSWVWPWCLGKLLKR